jgi:hypothetical protein
MEIIEIDKSVFQDAALPLQDELAGGLNATDLLALIRAAE